MRLPRFLLTGCLIFCATSCRASGSLIEAVRAGDYERAKTLLEGGANPNQRKGRGVIPVPALMSIGRGQTALCAAVEAGRPDIARLLIDHGADRGGRCGGVFGWMLFMEFWNHGRTPLGLATLKDDSPEKSKLVEVLLATSTLAAREQIAAIDEDFEGRFMVLFIPIGHEVEPFDPEGFSKLPEAKLPIYRALGKDTAELEAQIKAGSKVKDLEAKAKAGDAAAAYQLCRIYETGDGVEPDLKRAVEMCRKADDAEYPKARSLLSRVVQEAAAKDAADKSAEAAQESAEAAAASASSSGGLGMLAGIVGGLVPGSSALSAAQGLRGNVQAGIDMAQSAKANADAAERLQEMNIQAPAFFKDRSVAVLPVDNQTTDLQGPIVYRQLMQLQLGSAGFKAPGTDTLDGKLKDIGITDGGQLPAKTPADLGTALGADTLLYGELITFKNQNLGVYATRSVEAHAWLIDSKTGKKLWESTKKKSNPKVAVTGDAIKSSAITGYAGSILEKIMNNPLRQETEDVVRKLVKDMASSLDAGAAGPAPAP